MHMHDIEIVTIWFLAVSMGVILTILMPRMASASSRRSRTHTGWKELPAWDECGAHSGALVRMDNEPALTLVSTSWAWGIPRTAPEPAARDQNRAA
jgi:hypothetical protein